MAEAAVQRRAFPGGVLPFASGQTSPAQQTWFPSHGCPASRHPLLPGPPCSPCSFFLSLSLSLLLLPCAAAALIPNSPSGLVIAEPAARRSIERRETPAAMARTIRSKCSCSTATTSHPWRPHPAGSALAHTTRPRDWQQKPCHLT